MKKFSIKGASWDSVFLAFSKGLSLLFSILSAKILSTGLTLEGYGTYAQANLVLATGTSIILLGMGDALAYYFNNKEKTMDDSLRARTINTVFFIEIFLGLVLAVAIVLGKGLIADYFSNPAVQDLLYVVAILPVCTNVISMMQILCVSVGRAKWMSVYGLLLTVIRILAVYFSVCVLKNLVWIYVTILTMDIVHIALYNWDLRRKGVRLNPIRISVKSIPPILKYGLPMGIYAITSSFTRDLDKLVVGRLGGTEELAIYTNCSKILPFDFFVSSFAVVLIPYIYRRVTEGKREESIDLFSSYLKVGYYTVWALGTMVLVAPKTIISFLYADAYVVGVNVFILYVVDSMLRFASIHLVMTAAGKAKTVMTYSIVSLVLNLGFNILFYRWWGIIGPAIATVIVAIVYTFLILRGTTKIISAKWREVFNFKDVLWFVSTLALVWFVSFLLNKQLTLWGIHKYVSMIVSMLVFGLSVLAIHFRRIFGVLKKINSFKL